MSATPTPGAEPANPKHGSSTGPDLYLPGVGNGGYRVDVYDIDIDVRVSGGRVDGLAVLSAVATQTLSRFSLDLAGLVASKVSVNGTRAAKFSQDDGKLLIRPARPLADGQPFTVMVQYGGFPHPVTTARGVTGGWEERPDGVTVTGVPVGASTWFPCDARTDAAASFVLRVACDQSHTVAASGVATAPVVRGGRRRWVFTQERPVPLGSVGLQVGRFGDEAAKTVVNTTAPDTAAPDSTAPDIAAPDSTAPDATTLRLLFDAGAAEDLRSFLDAQERVLPVLEKLYGPLPRPTITTVVRAEPIEPVFAASLVTVFRGDLDDAQRGERLAVRALAAQWFGCTVFPASLADSWLTSGFARYSEWLWSERRGGGASADELARQYHSALSRQPQDIVIADPGAGRIDDDRIAGRGALTLHALRLTVGDDVFLPLLRTWADGTAPHAVATADFVAAAVASTSRPVDDLLERWLADEELPALPRPLA